jgi:hypothetical protein
MNVEEGLVTDDLLLNGQMHTILRDAMS